MWFPLRSGICGIETAWSFASFGGFAKAEKASASSAVPLDLEAMGQGRQWWIPELVVCTHRAAESSCICLCGVRGWLQTHTQGQNGTYNRLWWPWLLVCSPVAAGFHCECTEIGSSDGAGWGHTGAQLEGPAVCTWAQWFMLVTGDRAESEPTSSCGVCGCWNVLMFCLYM